MPSLLNIPLEIVGEVLEKLEPMDRLASRKVCRNLRAAIDNIGINFDEISLTFSKNHKEIWLRDISFNDALSILPYFNADMLDIIHLSISDNISQFERITYLDQWKSARSFHLSYVNFDDDYIEHLFRFEEFSISLPYLLTDTVVDIIDDLLTRPTFRECCIEFEGDEVKADQVLRLFDPDRPAYSSDEIEYSNDQGTFAIKCQLVGHYDYAFEIERLVE